MRVVHNTRASEYRTPYGAALVSDTVCLAIDIYDADIESVKVRVWIDGIGESFYDMKPSTDMPSRYKADIELDTVGIWWYSFMITTATGQVYFCCPEDGANGGSGRLVDWCASSFQLTVYKDREVKPSWYSDGICYQIFPDRFARGEGWKQLAENTIDKEKDLNGPRRVLNEDWSDTPTYKKTSEGRISEWEFFGGTLQGIISKLDYLASLDVSTLYLNPIFKASSNHRYDTGDYEEIDPMLGDMDDFKELCQKADKRGIHIVLDGVFNHTGCDSKYFNKYGNYDTTGAFQSSDSEYFDWYKFKDDGTYECWWGVDDLPDTNELNATYQDYIKSVVKKWISAGASGFRLDVADELPDSFIAVIKEALLEVKPDGLLIGEVWEDASNKISYSELRKYFLGDEIDSAMGYFLRKPLLGYVCGFNSGDVLANALEQMQENYPKFAFDYNMNLLGTHDTQRLFSVLGGAPDPSGMSEDEKANYKLDEHQHGMALGRLWLSVLMQMTLPGVPCVYYGDEAGCEGYADPYNRGTYPWGDEDKDAKTIYKNALDLRCTLSFFNGGDFKALHFDNDDLFGFVRSSNETNEQAVVLINRSMNSCNDVTVDRLNEKVVEVIGGTPLTITDESVSLTLNPLGSAVLYFYEGESLGFEFDRASGVLCHITSVPNSGKPGDIGEASYKFIDWLEKCNQKWWQVLPVNPCDEYGSPYAGLSAFAGNPYLCSDEEVEYGEAFDSFVKEQADWLYPYATFMALKDKFGSDVCWQKWPTKYRNYSIGLSKEKDLAKSIKKYLKQQYKFSVQWEKLLSCAHSHNVKIIGDIPMYVSSESADVWANKEIFSLDSDGYPLSQAGAPPDRFAETGQLWGNPTYKWDVLKQDNYEWWKKRFARVFSLYDIVRLDHFIGFSHYYSIEKGKSAKEGQWIDGPGKDLFDEVVKDYDYLPVIAEDLGLLTPGVRSLVSRCGFYGMDIIQFANGDIYNNYQVAPMKISYTSTHDTQTLVGYTSDKGCDNANFAALELMRSVANSDSDLCIFALQDVLGLDDTQRMNTPGVAEGNWTWQACATDLDKATSWLQQITKDGNR